MSALTNVACTQLEGCDSSGFNATASCEEVECLDHCTLSLFKLVAVIIAPSVVVCFCCYVVYKCYRRRTKSTTGVTQSPRKEASDSDMDARMRGLEAQLRDREAALREVMAGHTDDADVSLDAWLKRYKLERYADPIKAAGYDELLFLKDVRDTAANNWLTFR